MNARAISVVSSGLHTREDWVAVFPGVLESFLTDPETGLSRPTVPTAPRCCVWGDTHI